MGWTMQNKFSKVWGSVLQFYNARLGGLNVNIAKFCFSLNFQEMKKSLIMKTSYLSKVHLGFVEAQSWWDTADFVFPKSAADFKTLYTSNLPSYVLWLAQSPLHQFVMQFTQLEQMSPQTFVVSNKAFPLAATCWSLSLSLMLADSSYF